MACLIIVMRTFIVIASLAISMSAAAAEHRYILPFAGYARANDGMWLYSYTVVTNLSPRPATITTTDVYPVFADTPCSTPAPATLEPHARLRISPMICMGRLSSLAIVSLAGHWIGVRDARPPGHFRVRASTFSSHN